MTGALLLGRVAPYLYLRTVTDDEPASALTRPPRACQAAGLAPDGARAFGGGLGIARRGDRRWPWPSAHAHRLARSAARRRRHAVRASQRGGAGHTAAGGCDGLRAGRRDRHWDRAFPEPAAAGARRGTLRARPAIPRSALVGSGG